MASTPVPASLTPEEWASFTPDQRSIWYVLDRVEEKIKKLSAAIGRLEAKEARDA